MSDGNTPAPLLEVRDLAAGYGPRPVLNHISFTIGPGEIAAIIGPNGCGKSTLIKALLNLNTVYHGKVLVDGTDFSRVPTHRRITRGMVYLPQGNRVFDELTVSQNINLGGITLKPQAMRDRTEMVLELFPELKRMLNRPAYTLSGGERQMAAFARSMMLKPRLLMLDEPSIGLSPKYVSQVLAKAVAIRDQLGCSVLIVEQKVQQVLGVANTVIGMRMGRIALRDSSDNASKQLHELFL